MLRYLAEHSLDRPGVALKEYQIATEVLGRPAGFDPQSDSTVRVQAGRLRVKLAEYYAQEGVSDPILVEIPKGSYALTFQLRPSKAGVQLASPPALQEQEKRIQIFPSDRGWAIAVVVLSVLLAASSISSVLLLSQRVHLQATSSPPIPPQLQLFWNRFVAGPQPPWVIFSNGSFVGRPETGMRYFNPGSDARSFILDHYTGVGEVLAIHQLDHVFEMLNRPLRVKRGALFSLDDAKNNDLIFVGSPSENLTLLDIPGTQDFVFKRLDSGARKGDLAVINVHPQGGEAPYFLGTPANQPTTDDYAIVSLLPGLDPSRSILILAGATTFGTQAAVEYVCREDDVKALLQRLNVSKPADLKPFEAVLHVKIAHGVPVTTDLIALRTRAN
ncbi:MAG TPA: hypothetical protein VFA67_08060 [Candidatus Sulfotelmatobacter sp.]|nr:hypothetical protein [Candidatus Sulfotelmatobacter sp.]